MKELGAVKKEIFMNHFKRQLLDKSLDGEVLLLRLLQLSDCDERYVGWLKDEGVNGFLETRWAEQTFETVSAFVKQMLNDSSNFLFGIFLKDSGQHIGNIKLGPINYHHLYADVSYFIGEKQCWGRGYATEAIKLITTFGFDQLGLCSIQAGLYESNVASMKALLKSNFKLVGRYLKQLKNKNCREDHLLFQCLPEKLRELL